MRTLKGLYLPLLLVLAAAFGTNGSHAQSYPTKPIRFHTAGTGGGADLVARIVGPEISTVLGQPVVVENRPTSTLASGVAKAVPDGYTLLIWGGGMWVTPLLREATYDPIRDFAPITGLSKAPSVFVVHPSLPVKSVQELITLAKSRPGQLNFSTGTPGGSSSISGELFKYLAGIDIVLVPHKVQTQETQALLSGQVQMTSLGAVAVVPLLKAGKVRALATTGTQRSVMFPDLPTVTETLPGFISQTLFAAFAPARTPDAILKRLNQEMVRALAKPAVRDAVLNSGYETAGGDPEQLADYVKSEMARVGKLIKEVGIKIE